MTLLRCERRKCVRACVCECVGLLARTHVDDRPLATDNYLTIFYIMTRTCAGWGASRQQVFVALLGPSAHWCVQVRAFAYHL